MALPEDEFCGCAACPRKRNRGAPSPRRRDLAKELHRDARSFVWLEQTVQDCGMPLEA
jgi:hypothetical protein